MREISPEEFKDSLVKESGNKDVDFINVCTQAEYQEKHIKGVRSVPLDTLQNHLSEFTGKRAVYVHCQGGSRGRKATQLLEELGVTADLVNLEGGLMAWSSANLPTESFTHRMPLMRQVMLTAGIIIVASITLTLTVDPAFIFIALFIGAGEMFSGITGWCGLSLLLERMPWNK